MSMCDSEVDQQDGSDNNWSDAEEDDQDKDDQKCPCPFCDEILSSVEGIFSHCLATHNIDLLKLKLSLGLGTYGWIKLINYIRNQHPTIHDLLNILAPPFPWDGDQFLQPVLPDDPLLQWDFDEEEGGCGTTEESIGMVFSEGNRTTEQLEYRLREVEMKLTQSEDRLQQAYRDIDTMRKAMSGIISDDKNRENGNLQEKRAADETTERESEEEKDEEEEEDSYFTTYTHFSIHEEMLKDKVRMESYQLFISRNPELFKDKVVLDVGCGTGILSMMALKSGASHVIAIDQSRIIYKAIEIARENGLLDKITFIRSRVEDTKLPVDKVDVIISEWMGYMLLFESMMDTVLFARDTWLKDPTQVYPNNCSISVVAMGDQFEYQNNIDFWNSVEGFKMSCMRREALNEARVMVVDEYSLISSADVIKKFDLTVVKPVELEFESKFALTMLQNTDCHAIVSYFDIGFAVPTYPVYFSTSPQDVPTHWRQTVMFLGKPLPVKTGDMLRGVFKCTRHPKDHRYIIIRLKMELDPLNKDNSEGVAEPIIIEQRYTI